jgi:DNA-binding PadR family transcriptional regulator
MSLKHGLLGLLNYRPMTGYELNKVFDGSISFFWQAQTSQIYRELNAMKRSGLLVSEQIIQEDHPNKKVYSITDAGRAEFLNWLSPSNLAIEDTLHIRSTFLMQLFFAGETSGEQALSTLTAFRDKCEKTLLEFDVASEVADQYDMFPDSENRIKYWKLLAMFGETLFLASLDWADMSIAILTADDSLISNRPSDIAPDTALESTRQLAAHYRPDGKERVLEFFYTDTNETYQIVLTADGAEVISENFRRYTTRIETPLSVWIGVQYGAVSRRQAMYSQKFKVFGNIDILMRWTAFFGV